MTALKIRVLVPALVLAAAAGCASAWLSGMGWVTGSWWVRGGLCLAGIALALSGMLLAFDRFAQQQQAARRYLELLLRLQSSGTLSDSQADGLPTLAADSAWRGALLQLKQDLLDASTRLHEVEQSRAALEIRLQRQADQAERASAILSGLADPVLAVDSYGSLLMANPSAEQLFGLDAKKVESRAMSRLLECERLLDVLNDTRKHRSSASRNEDIEITDMRGEKHWYRVTSRSLTGDGAAARDHEPSAAVAVLRDISAERAAQQRNAEFISAVSHEMKTPLAGIKAYVELLADGDAEDEATREEFLSIINGQADRMQRLIDNLLNLSRIEAGVVKVSKHCQSLNEILTEALRLVRPSAEAKGIDLVEQFSSLYLGVLVDRDLLLQAAINLLSNAIKYTPSGGQVMFRSQMGSETIEFEVEDTGVGLSPEDCQRVFEKFYRVEKDKKMASGTGLGLPLAKHIVEDVHGGHLTVDSTLAVGSIFSVSLPVARQTSPRSSEKVHLGANA